MKDARILSRTQLAQRGSEILLPLGICHLMGPLGQPTENASSDTDLRAFSLCMEINNVLTHST